MARDTQIPRNGPLSTLRNRPVTVDPAFAAPDEESRWSDETQHLLRTPGAYEWWYFHAISPAGDGVIFAAFEGLPFRPPQLRSNRRSSATSLEKRSPSAGSTAAPAAYMALYQGGKKIAQFLNVYPTDSHSTRAGDIRIGPNRIMFRNDGSIGITAKGYPYDIVRGRPRHRLDQVLSAQLDFTPSFPVSPHHRAFRAPNSNGAMHHWILSAPHGQVSGSVQVVDARENSSVHDVRIATPGYHDHVYGQGDLADGISKQMWGFLQGETWTAVWHQTLYKHASGNANGLVLFEKGKKSVIVEAPESKLSDFQVGRWLTRYPGSIAMHGVDEKGRPVEMLLKHDGMLDGAPFHTGLSASGMLTIPGRGSYSGSGASHSLQLRRLRWPILSDMTLLAITRVQRDDPLWQQ
jgi:carotenoid 1,2-hydratase